MWIFWRKEEQMAISGQFLEAHLEERARRLVDILESAGPSCGLTVIKRAVVMRCPGAPSTDLPTIYDEADLNNAVELSLLERRKMRADALTGSFEREYYVIREKSVK
jgi:hypothetical protein